MQSSWLLRNALWLLLPHIALCSLVFGLTLHGQPDAYWCGDFNTANEMPVPFAHFLSLHPLAFVAAGIHWTAVFSALIVLLPERFAVALVVTIVIGHSASAATWLAHRFNSYQSCNILFLVTSGLIVFAFKRGQNIDGQTAFNWELMRLSRVIRWTVVAALFALPSWWFVIPR